MLRSKNVYSHLTHLSENQRKVIENILNDIRKNNHAFEEIFKANFI